MKDPVSTPTDLAHTPTESVLGAGNAGAGDPQRCRFQVRAWGAAAWSGRTGASKRMWARGSGGSRSTASPPSSARGAVVDAAVEGRALPWVRTSPSTPRAETRSRFQAKATDKGVGTVDARIDEARHAAGRSDVVVEGGDGVEGGPPLSARGRGAL
eukprot:3469626-Prymnesium_polylepis.1